MSAPRQVHVLAGIFGGGRRIRAACWCGWTTTPRVTKERALAAFRAAHPTDPLVCALCGRTRSEPDYLGRPAALRVLDDGELPPILVCRDLDRACRDGAAQRQVHLDRAAFDAFDAEPPRPRFRVVR
jgi:hypothetical protein